MKFKRIIEVPSNKGVQGPYLHHKASDIKDVQKILGYEKDPIYFELFFDVEHQDVQQIMKAIQIMRDEAAKDFLFENRLNELIYKHFTFAQHLNNPQFEQSNMEANDSEILTQKRVKLIAPLLSIDGIVCITSKRVYFQPVHDNILNEKVLSLEIKNLI